MYATKPCPVMRRMDDELALVLRSGVPRRRSPTRYVTFISSLAAGSIGSKPVSVFFCFFVLFIAPSLCYKTQSHLTAAIYIYLLCQK